MLTPSIIIVIYDADHSLNWGMSSGVTIGVGVLQQPPTHFLSNCQIFLLMLLDFLLILS